MIAHEPVSVRRETVVIPTYHPFPPDQNPMFLERRVYQGSSGRVYPLPVIDRIAEEPTPTEWDAVFIENTYLLVMLLPQLGGRIHRVLDKTNGYDAIYYQPVIKPALVGLAGPWCSGGIEFNWPQHHRPSTFMPTEVAVERHDDGSAIVWMSEHEPMTRMKGMHGVRLRPGRAVVEIAVRVHNRTPDRQTFLWWTNIATRVHEAYQSFFPPDVTHVADHARRATSAFPHCAASYYGVDYAARARRGTPPGEAPARYRPSHLGDEQSASHGGAVPAYRADDLSWYANIPVPTSYMCPESTGDFFGGYDHRARAGLIHVADRHIAPGKKQWTWGNHEFGYSWDRNLTDADPATREHRPYIELMAGVYTDNQPDFSFIQPGETRTWTQHLYPYRSIGPAHHANAEAAVRLDLEKGIIRIGIAVTSEIRGARIELVRKGAPLARWRLALAPDRPLLRAKRAPTGTRLTDLTLRVVDADGAEIIRYSPCARKHRPIPVPAEEPAPPAGIATNDALYLTGLHLEQYRHATRSPEAYWREAVARDPGDARCNLALGKRHMHRGEFAEAERHLRASIARLTRRNANPEDGEAYYQLGLCLRHQALARGLDRERLEQARGAFAKATWNQAWGGPSSLALAELDALDGRWTSSLEQLDRALAANPADLRAANLRVIVLRRLGHTAEATAQLRRTRSLEPLDPWSRHLDGAPIDGDDQVRLDIAVDLARAGLFPDAIAILESAPTGATRASTKTAQPAPVTCASLGAAPLIRYHLAWLYLRSGDARAARRLLREASRTDLSYCFPARLEELAILREAVAANPRDGAAFHLLGNWLYDRRRHREAIAAWRRAVRLRPENAVAWRNLGLACHNILRDTRAARRAYARAVRARPEDARLLFERDQLWKRLGESPDLRLRELERHAGLVRLRDDLSIELCALYNQTGQPDRAREILASRRFQPWEGGEGQVLAEHVRTHLALGRRALAAARPDRARELFQDALDVPDNLGEARHLLTNTSEIHYHIGCACAAAGADEDARSHWETAAAERGDFREMRPTDFSEATLHSARALARLGRANEARRRLRALLNHARRLGSTPACIDYFATSLPTMLLFEDDLGRRQATRALFLEAQARLGLRETAVARKLLRRILARDPAHAPAADLLAESAARR